MALLSMPIYALVLPFLFLFTLPVALFATATTAFAFSILALRVIVVYIDLALAVIPHYLLAPLTQGSQSSSFNRTKSFSSSPNGHGPSSRRKRRRGSNSSSVSVAGSITPISDSALGLSQLQPIGPTRDYEGVGGWRLDNPSDDEGLWTNINSRLELPADHGRRHHRSLTSGSMSGDARADRSYSPEAERMLTMNTSRARTPPSSVAGIVGEGYFSQLPISPKASKHRALSSSTGSSGSSKGSSVLSMKHK